MPTPPRSLIARLVDAERVVEVGVGRRPDLARALARRGVAVTATDVRERSVPPEVAFVRDDVTDPDPAVYDGADAVVARRLPPELHRPTRAVAREAGATFLFTTLGGDPPAVPVESEQLPDGVTLYRATERGRRG